MKYFKGFLIGMVGFVMPIAVILGGFLYIVGGSPGRGFLGVLYVSGIIGGMAGMAGIGAISNKKGE